MEQWRYQDEKINNKGITAIELLVCFIIVSVIVVSLFDLIMSYRNREQIEEINNEVVAFANNLQKVIQDDLIKGHLVNVTNVGTDGYSATLSFDSPSAYTTTITIKPTEELLVMEEVEILLTMKYLPSLI